MNNLIETLRAGAPALVKSLVWPMLWQSSLLIALLFTLDLTSRRKVRAAVRYALWLVVLVKLMLPPSLALPTGLGWWLRPSVPMQPRFPAASFVVSYGSDATTGLRLRPTPGIVPLPRTRLPVAAWAVVASGAISLGLLAWMLGRWRQVAGAARHATPAPAWLNEQFDHVCRRSHLFGESGQARSREAGFGFSWFRFVSNFGLRISDLLLRRPIRLRIVARPLSPSVCGLFRPVMLLPRALVDQLPPAQLRAVMLHELMHVRRGDIWVNCAQALLQIVYWWHPLLWLANARIRRLREEAVDDAVMLALRDEAEAYAPSLLEVARLALRRPLASLGLIGIFESHKSLRRRIERLLEVRPLRKARLTFTSVLCVFGFAMVALPMGEAPPKPALSSVEQAKDSRSLVQDGKLLYEMGKLSEAEESLTEAIKQDPRNQAAYYYLNLVREAREREAHNKHGLRRRSIPSYSWTNLPNASPTRRDILNQLASIRLESVTFDHLPLDQVLSILTTEARKGDPAGGGLKFTMTSNVDAGTGATNGGTAVDPATGLPVAAAASATTLDMSSILINLSRPLTNVSLADALDAIVKVADKPLRYSIEDDAVVFAPRTYKSEPVYSRVFKIDPKPFLTGLGLGAGNLETNDAAAICSALPSLFAAVGVDLDPPETWFFSYGECSLLVRATKEDLDKIEATIQSLNAVPGQVTEATPARAAPFSATNSSFLPPLPKSLYEPWRSANMQQTFWFREAKRKSIGVGQDGSYWLGTNRADLAGLRSLLSKAKRTSADVSVCIEADKHSPWRSIVALMDLCKELGVSHVSASTETPAQSPEVEEKAPVRGDRPLTGRLRGNESNGAASGVATIVAEPAVSDSAPPQINIKAKFFEMPEKIGDQLWPTLGLTNSGGNADTAILTAAQARAALAACRQQGIDELTESGITTLSGRQARVQVTHSQDVVTNVIIDPRALTPPGVSSDAVVYLSGPMEFGPALDVMAQVQDDGFNIELIATATVNEFLGYDEPTNSVPVYVNNRRMTVNPPLPHFRVREMATKVTVPDGDALLLGSSADQNNQSAETEGRHNSRLLVFVMPTIIDANGNRLHSEEELSPALK